MNESTGSRHLVERFTLRGLHGYKDITLNLAGEATVIAAENGTGKTTVLSALNAFLTRRFHRLASLSFKTLECKFAGLDELVVLDRAMLGTVTEDATETLKKVAARSSLPESELVDFVQATYSPANFERLRADPIVRQIYVNTPGDIYSAKRVLDELYAEYSGTFGEAVKEIIAKVRHLVGDTEIVYLPTYRRIERPLLRARRREASPSGPFFHPHRPDRKEYSYEGIAFGLGDIEARLSELSEEIERTSNFGYRALSARMLNDMLKGRLEKTMDGPVALPEIRDLSLFLGRLGRVENNLSNLFDDIEVLYDSQKIWSDDYEFLRYFLTRLRSVIEETKGMERQIEQFVNVSNSYLMMSSDEKLLSFEPRTLKVVVKNSWSDSTVPLDALSSGEKQIVSLMGKLYLYGGKKIVLVDEPELSLSLDWQRKVLPDVLKSGSVIQLVAITHSPFIFDNDLDKFATALEIRKSKDIADE